MTVVHSVLCLDFRFACMALIVCTLCDCSCDDACDATSGEPGFLVSSADLSGPLTY